MSFHHRFSCFAFSAWMNVALTSLLLVFAPLVCCQSIASISFPYGTITPAFSPSVYAYTLQLTTTSFPQILLYVTPDSLTTTLTYATCTDYTCASFTASPSTLCAPASTTVGACSSTATALQVQLATTISSWFRLSPSSTSSTTANVKKYVFTVTTPQGATIEPPTSVRPALTTFVPASNTGTLSPAFDVNVNAYTFTSATTTTTPVLSFTVGSGTVTVQVAGCTSAASCASPQSLTFTPLCTSCASSTSAYTWTVLTSTYQKYVLELVGTTVTLTYTVTFVQPTPTTISPPVTLAPTTTTTVAPTAATTTMLVTTSKSPYTGTATTFLVSLTAPLYGGQLIPSLSQTYAATSNYGLYVGGGYPSINALLVPGPNILSITYTNCGQSSTCTPAGTPVTLCSPTAATQCVAQTQAPALPIFVNYASIYTLITLMSTSGYTSQYLLYTSCSPPTTTLPPTTSSATTTAAALTTAPASTASSAITATTATTAATSTSTAPATATATVVTTTTAVTSSAATATATATAGAVTTTTTAAATTTATPTSAAPIVSSSDPNAVAQFVIQFSNSPTSSQLSALSSSIATAINVDSSRVSASSQSLSSTSSQTQSSRSLVFSLLFRLFAAGTFPVLVTISPVSSSASNGGVSVSAAASALTAQLTNAGSTLLMSSTFATLGYVSETGPVYACANGVNSNPCQTTTSAPSSSSSSSSNIGAIVGGVVGGVVCLVLIIVLVVVCIKRNKSSDSKMQPPIQKHTTELVFHGSTPQPPSAPMQQQQQQQHEHERVQVDADVGALSTTTHFTYADGPKNNLALTTTGEDGRAASSSVWQSNSTNEKHTGVEI